MHHKDNSVSMFLGNQRADFMTVSERLGEPHVLGKLGRECSCVFRCAQPVEFSVKCWVGIYFKVVDSDCKKTIQRRHKSDAVLVKKGAKHFLFSEYLGCETKSKGILSDCNFAVSSTLPFIILLQYYIPKEGLALTVVVHHWSFVL